MLQQFAPMNHCYQQFQLGTFLQDVSELGFKTIDLWTCPAHFYVDNHSHDETESLKRQLTNLGLKISCISPRQSSPQPFHLAVKGTDMIQRTKNYFQQVIYSAHELEVPRVMITSGWSFRDEAWEEAWKRSVEMCQWLSIFAESNGVKVAIEPLTSTSTKLVNSLERMQQYLTAVNQSNLKVIIDTGTIFRGQESISQYFQAFGETIDYCHLTNYQTGQFAHVNWQDGELDLTNILNEFADFGYQGAFCLEFTHPSYRENPREVYQKTYDQLIKMEEKK